VLHYPFSFAFHHLLKKKKKLFMVQHYKTFLLSPVGAKRGLDYNPKPGNTKGGTVDLLFHWFVLVCFANKNKNFQ
jgi:hypothetical protein